MNIGIIGYGSMGKMLLWKFAESGITKDNLLISNRTQQKLEEARDIATICSNAEASRRSDILFICVRPTDFKEVLQEVNGNLSDDALLVTLNGSISFDLINRIVEHKTAKVIPSLTAQIDRSQTLVCYNGLVTNNDKQNLRDLLSVIGEVIELPENEMGMGSELVSCMPGFIASMFDVVCNSAGKHTNIPQDQVINMVLNTVCATADLLLQENMSFEQTVSRVATKGGITEEGTKVIYERFPDVADELFEKTLEKRRITAKKAEESYLPVVGEE